MTDAHDLHVQKLQQTLAADPPLLKSLIPAATRPPFAKGVAYLSGTRLGPVDS